MPACKSGPGKIGDLILLKTVFSQKADTKVIHIPLQIRIRQLQDAGIQLRRQRRSFLRNQAVCADVIRMKG